jgi:RNA polymerase subunit RPABC4/transcription elongation factor Spt4
MIEQDDEDDDADGDAPDPDSADWNDDPAEVPCPYCKRDIDEDASRCPYCGSYLSIEDAPPQRKPWWWLLVVVLLVLVLLGYLLK